MVAGRSRGRSCDDDGGAAAIVSPVTGPRRRRGARRDRRGPNRLEIEEATTHVIVRWRRRAQRRSKDAGPRTSILPLTSSTLLALPPRKAVLAFKRAAAAASRACTLSAFAAASFFLFGVETLVVCVRVGDTASLPEGDLTGSGTGSATTTVSTGAWTTLATGAGSGLRAATSTTPSLGFEEALNEALCAASFFAWARPPRTKGTSASSSLSSSGAANLRGKTPSARLARNELKIENETTHGLV